MAEDKLIQILSSPKGVNSVDDPKSEVFAPASQSKPQPPYLRHAVNVDIDRTGSIHRRAGYTKLRTLTRGHSGFSSGGDFYYADNGAIYRFRRTESTDEAIVTGLNQYADLSYVELAGQVFWSNGNQNGRIVSGAASFWGLAASAPPSLSATNGGLRRGTYLVAVAEVRNGVESGCREATEITVSDGQGIAVSGSFDTNADYLSVYCSDTNGQDLFWVKDVPVGAFVIDQVSTSTYLFQGLGAYPPPPGRIVRAWNGYLIVATDSAQYGQALYFSEPGAPHRFRLDTDRIMLPARPVLVETFSGGFFYALADGTTWWVDGTDPRKSRRQQVDNRLVSEGQAARVPARKLPFLQIPGDTVVAVWGTADGLAVGLPDGSVRHPTDGIYAHDANKKATVAYVERPGLRQLLLAARDRGSQTRLAIGDQATATVTRGGVPV